VLRAMREEDAAFIWSATRTPGFTDGMHWKKPSDLPELVASMRGDLALWKVGLKYSYIAVLRGMPMPVGHVAIRAEPRQDDWSIGFWTSPLYWGQGYATEIASALVQFAFSRLGARTVRAAHASENEASRRVIEKLGMSLSRAIPDAFEVNGKTVDDYEYLIEMPQAEQPAFCAPGGTTNDKKR